MPAQAKGYERIWLVGVSLGGMGALLYSQAHPQDIAGFYALAPYLGESPLLQAVRQSGLAQWHPVAPDAIGAQAWRLAQAYANGAPGLPQGHVGYGQGDRFAQANAMFASALPAHHRYVVEGGHDWRTWLALWTAFLDDARSADPLWRVGACAQAPGS
ncbi:MAG: alpha/beta fold hydrolase [Burkholderiaceae bacterium]